ncbi:MAG: HAD family phosphatase [Bacteroidaceae bacterium]|nr:HAD family phosphatase [Bacteroidaceae bacterium]
METYKLIAIDLDGTLVRSDQSISQRTMDALVRVQEMGVKVVVASGRPTYGTAHVADALQLERFGGFVMSYNGGEIYNWQTKEVLHAQTLDKEVIPYLYRYAKAQGLPIMTYIGKEVVSEVKDNEYIRYSEMRNRMTIRQVDDFVATAQGAGVVKCIIVGDPTLLPALEKELQVTLKGKAGAFRSEPFFLEIVPEGIDKAKGLEILLDKMGVKREEVIAFGDGYNDRSMMEFAGTSVAMGNGAEEIKNAADFVTRSNNDDGIVYALEKLIPRLLDKPY